MENLFLDCFVGNFVQLCVIKDNHFETVENPTQC